jgi:hypothetical protein
LPGVKIRVASQTILMQQLSPLQRQQHIPPSIDDMRANIRAFIQSAPPPPPDIQLLLAQLVSTQHITVKEKIAFKSSR